MEIQLSIVSGLSSKYVSVTVLFHRYFKSCYCLQTFLPCFVCVTFSVNKINRKTVVSITVSLMSLSVKFQTYQIILAKRNFHYLSNDLDSLFIFKCNKFDLKTILSTRSLIDDFLRYFYSQNHNIFVNGRSTTITMNKRSESCE